MNQKLTNLLRIELRKSLRNRFFLFALFVGLLFVLLSACSRLSQEFSESGFRAFVDRQLESGVIDRPIVPASTLYNNWIGGEITSVGFSMFFTLYPLLAILPYGHSFSEEVHSGYIKNVVPRCGRRNYFATKITAAFFSGGIAITVPLIISLMICAMFFPAAAPNVVYAQYLQLGHENMLAALGHSHPLAYVGVYLLLDFTFAGLFSCLSISVAFFTSNRLLPVIVPFFALLGCDMARGLLTYISYVEISPLKFLHAAPVVNYTKGEIVLLWLIVLNLLTFLLIFKKGRKYEIL